jgi:plasmid stabilization system protein ParE
MKPYTFHPEASIDLDDAIDHYENERRGLGRRFAGEVDVALSRIREGISGGSPWLRNTRIQRVNDFPYGIVFREFEKHVYVLAVYHFSRRKGYWFHRLGDLPDEENPE